MIVSPLRNVAVEFASVEFSLAEKTCTEASHDVCSDIEVRKQLPRREVTFRSSAKFRSFLRWQLIAGLELLASWQCPEQHEQKRFIRYVESTQSRSATMKQNKTESARHLQSPVSVANVIYSSISAIAVWRGRGDAAGQLS